MQSDHLHLWEHSHSFGQELRRPGELRTLTVISITGSMMAVEIVMGIVSGSMALLADGVHVASQATALGLLRTTSAVLLDRQGPASVRDEIRASIEQDRDSKVADLHL